MARRLFLGLLAALDRGLFPRGRKWLWRGLYGSLSRSWPDETWRFMNYGFVPEGHPFALEEADEPDRPFIGLYQQAVAGLPLAGARILEIGSGRGGGAAYLARYHAPDSVVGLDYSPGTVGLARRLNRQIAPVAFETGDAERLPFADGAFDIVVNIESSHCYADVPAFAREVARVLAPGGWLTFADMRSRDRLRQLDTELSAPGLELREERDITAGVVRALDAAEERKQARMRQLRLGRGFMREFAGCKGSALYEDLAAGRVVYVARRYQKSG